MISINTDFNNMFMRNNLNTAQKAVLTSLQRMSTGYKINSSKDNAAGMFSAEKLSTQINGLNQAQKNIADGVSLLQTAEGSLSEINRILTRLRDLSVQASSDVYDEASRKVIQSEADDLIKQLKQVRQSTIFNGLNLFDDAENTSGASVLALSGGGGLTR